MELRPEKYGPFANLFENDGENAAVYSLLTLQGPEVADVLRALHRAAFHRHASHFISELLRDYNWRPQLVGAVACLIRRNADNIACVWNAIDAGSWVTPQLGVVVYCLDRSVATGLRTRVDSGCPVSSVEGLSDLERHWATGHAGNEERSGKMMATLLELSSRVPGIRQWRERALASLHVQEVLASNIDSSEQIFAAWLGNLDGAFASASLPCPLPSAHR